MKSRRVCLGMKVGQAYSVIHNENSYASGHRKRPRGPRPAPMIEITGNLHYVQQPALVDLKTQATTYYLHYHLQTSKDAAEIPKGVLDECLPLWMSEADSPMLDLAVSSLALAVFSRTKHHPTAAIEALKQYNQLLKVAQVTIISLGKSNIDACLLAIAFMGRYEEVIYRPGSLNLNTPFVTTMQSFSHHDGALATLKFWKYQLSQSQPATDVIKHTRRGLIRSALMRDIALPEWMLDGTAFGEYGPELEYDRIVVRISDVRQRLSTLLKEDTSQYRSSRGLNSAAEELNKESQDLDMGLQKLTAQFPGAWCHQRHTLSEPHPWPIRDFYSTTVHSYSNLAHAAACNLYYATRLLINSTRLRILELSAPSPDNSASGQRLECLFHMTSMANDLASSIPFCLQRFKVTNNPKSSTRPKLITLDTNDNIRPYMATLIVWPLTIASCLGDVDAKQATWFRSELSRLGRVVGVGVLECAETDQWLEF